MQNLSKRALLSIWNFLKSFVFLKCETETGTPTVDVYNENTVLLFIPNSYINTTTVKRMSFAKIWYLKIKDRQHVFIIRS